MSGAKGSKNKEKHVNYKEEDRRDRGIRQGQRGGKQTARITKRRITEGQRGQNPLQQHDCCKKNASVHEREASFPLSISRAFGLGFCFRVVSCFPV